MTLVVWRKEHQNVNPGTSSCRCSHCCVNPCSGFIQKSQENISVINQCVEISIRLTNNISILKCLIADVISDQLDYLKVQFNVDGAYDFRCSEHPSRVKSGDIIRVNCEAITKLYKELRINSHYNFGLDIAEIELHTFGMFYKTYFIFLSK